MARLTLPSKELWDLSVNDFNSDEPRDKKGRWTAGGVGDLPPHRMVPRLPTALLGTGMMVVDFLSLVCGMVLDTVT